jgi:hypothetical protein
VTKQRPFDPYALFAALERERVSYVVVGGFARVVHGSAETSDGLDIVPSLREENLRRLGRALEQLAGGCLGRHRLGASQTLGQVGLRRLELLQRAPEPAQVLLP